MPAPLRKWEREREIGRAKTKGADCKSRFPPPFSYYYSFLNRLHHFKTLGLKYYDRQIGSIFGNFVLIIIFHFYCGRCGVALVRFVVVVCGVCIYCCWQYLLYCAQFMPEYICPKSSTLFTWFIYDAFPQVGQL